jgi:two-component system cell cycle sensor histidine kinase/response regulator CckA
MVKHEPSFKVRANHQKGRGALCMKKLTPFRIVVYYLVLSVAWIASSDLIVAAISKSPEMITTLSIVKGWLFVLTTALLLYGLITRYAWERSRAEEALRDSQQAYQALAENLPGIVYRVFSQENNRIQCFSKTAQSIIGYDDTELSRGEVCSLESLILPEDRPRVVATVKQAIADHRPFTTEYRLRHKNGQIHYLLEQGTPIYDRDGNILHIDGVILDITERRQAEQALQESEVQYHTLFDGSPDAIFIADPETGIILDSNPAACKLLARQREEIIGIHQSKLHPPQTEIYSRETFHRHYKETNEPGAIHPIENTVLRSDGIEVPVEVTAQTVTIKGKKVLQGVFRDITERKKADLALKESEEKFKELADTLPQTVYEIDEKGKFIYLNKTGLNTFGYSREDVASGLTVMQLIAPEDQERVKQDITSRPQSDRSDNQEYSGLTKKGRTFPVVVHSIPVKRNNRLTGFRGIAIDVSERKYFEEELLKTQKLESLGILAGGIAHDFNNILTAIVGNIALIRMRIKDDPVTLQRLNEAEKASFHARDLTLQLLTFSKGGAPVKTMISLERVIQDSASFALRGSNVQCDFRFVDDLRTIEADAGQLGQVFNNLIINACQAMPAGGTITIAADNVVIAAQDGMPLHDGRYVKISVQDQGIGIPEEHIQKIFDPYFTTKQQGSGLGLAVTYSIVKNHNGHIAVQSKPGTGTTFTLYLPAAEEQPLGIQPDSEKCIHGSGRILLMDDEEMVRNVAGAILGELGYEVVFARDGNEALELFSKAMKASKPYRAVILDLTVPAGVGGKEAIRMLQDIDPDIRAIASSGYSHDPVMANYREYGFRGVIAKPYKPSELSRILHSVITS